MGVDGLHKSVERREQAGKQHTAAGRPESSHELLVSPDGEDRRQEFLRHLEPVSNRKGSEGGTGTYILAWGFLNVGATPTPSPPVAIASRKGRRQIPAEATRANGGVCLREPPRANNRTRREERRSLELHAVESGRSVGAGVRKAHELSEAVVLVRAHDAAQQASLARVRILLRGGLGLRRRGLVAVVVGLVVLVVRVVAVVLFVGVEVHRVVKRNFNRRNVAGRARNTRGTARGNPAAAARPRSSGRTTDGHHHGAAALATATTAPLAGGSRWASGAATAAHTRGTTARGRHGAATATTTAANTRRNTPRRHAETRPKDAPENRGSRPPEAAERGRNGEVRPTEAEQTENRRQEEAVLRVLV